MNPDTVDRIIAVCLWTFAVVAGNVLFIWVLSPWDWTSWLVP